MSNIIEVGDMVFCKKSYIETECGRSFRMYATNGRLVHLLNGQQYKVVSLSDDEIKVINDFGIEMWYDMKRFDKLKEMRRQKLINLRKVLFVLIIFLVASCVKYTESEPITIKSKIVYRHHEDKKSEFTYHYGYSIMKGGFSYHWGNEDIDEKNIVKFVFSNDTIEKDDKSLFYKDSIDITYVKVYQIVHQDSVFYRNSIRNIN